MAETISAKAVAKKLVDSAIAHTEDSGEPHWQGDLEIALEVALEMLGPQGRSIFVYRDEIQEVFDNGLRARGEDVIFDL